MQTTLGYRRLIGWIAVLLTAAVAFKWISGVDYTALMGRLIAGLFGV